MLLELVAGFGLLLAGGESLVRGSVSIARRLGISPLVIGLTLVGFGTSAPELVTCIEAALVGAPAIAVGNVVGSNIANVLLVLGLAAALRPIVCDPRAFYRDGSAVAVAALLCVPMALAGTIGRLWGAGLLALLACYTVFTYLADRRQGGPAAALHEQEATAAEPAPRSLWLGLLLTLAGLGITVWGARLLVDGAVALAAAAGVSQTIVGLTVVAVGTSLPELVTAVVASLRNQSDVALGNIVGSCIFNVLGILGATALVRPIAVPPEILAFDLWVMLGVIAALIAFAVSGWRLSRGEGLVLLAGYGLYIGILAATA